MLCMPLVGILSCTAVNDDDTSKNYALVSEITYSGNGIDSKDTFKYNDDMTISVIKSLSSNGIEIVRTFTYDGNKVSMKEAVFMSGTSVGPENNYTGTFNNDGYLSYEMNEFIDETDESKYAKDEYKYMYNNYYSSTIKHTRTTATESGERNASFEWNNGNLTKIIGFKKKGEEQNYEFKYNSYTNKWNLNFDFNHFLAPHSSQTYFSEMFANLNKLGKYSKNYMSEYEDSNSNLKLYEYTFNDAGHPSKIEFYRGNKNSLVVTYDIEYTIIPAK